MRARVFAIFTPTAATVDGKGSYVTTDDGTRLLDFSTGIGVANLGHCHPKVVKAVQEQAGRIMHAQVRSL